MQKRAFCVCLFYFFHDTSNFNILNVFRCLLGWIKLALKFKDFPAPTANFKDFQGRTFKVHARPVTFLLCNLSIHKADQVQRFGQNICFIFLVFALSFGIFFTKINVFARAEEKSFLVTESLSGQMVIWSTWPDTVHCLAIILSPAR